MNEIVINKSGKVLPILFVMKVYVGFLMSNSFYSFGLLNKLLIFIIWGVFLLLHCKSEQIRKASFRWSFFLISVYFVFVNIYDPSNENQWILYNISLVYIFASLKKKIQILTFKYFVFTGTILLTASIIEYILYVGFGIGKILGTFDRGEGSNMQVIQGLFNYYAISQYSLFRFQSLFREPGSLGQCAALVTLFWGRIPLKQSIVWLVSGLMTVSLFFYFFLVISLPFIVSLQRGGLKIVHYKYLFAFSMLLCASYIAVPEEVHNIFSERIEKYMDEGKDNRSTQQLNNELKFRK